MISRMDFTVVLNLVTVTFMLNPQPRRIPRPVMKKTKKQKETDEEETTNETDNKEHDKTENENLETKEERNDEDAVKERDVEDSLYRTPNVVNMPPGEEKPLLQQGTTGSQRGPGTSALPQEMESSRPTKDEAKAPFKETAKGYEVYILSPTLKTITREKRKKFPL